MTAASAAWVRVALAVLCVVATSCVVGDRSSADPLPPAPARVAITMHDYRFEIGGPVPTGRVIFEVTNRGTMTHSLSLIALPEDFPPIDEQLRGDVRRGAPTVARVPARPPGTGSRFALDAAPGRYALVCFIADPDGVIHGAKGMNAEFRII